MSAPVFAAIDLELTGLKVAEAEIIEIGLVRCTPDEVLERWSTLVRPYTMPDLRIQRITGITPEMLSGAPRFEEVEEELRGRLADAIPIGHNVRFDLNHLGAAGIESARPPLDTLPIAQVLDPAAPTHRLGDLCERYSIVMEQAHRALADADASRMLLLALRRLWGRLDTALRQQLAELSERSDPTSPLSVFISTVADGGADSSAPAAPRRLRAAPPRRAPERSAVQLPAAPLVELTAAALDAAAEEPDGEFEARPEQRAMALDVARALEVGEVGLVEAGTGVGKSLAYLIPAALWSLRSRERVVVSTHTRNLQHQLADHDIPQLREILERVAPGAGQRLHAAVLKGRANYLCRRNLDRQRSRVLDRDEALVVARALVWAHGSESGDREELRLPRVHEQIWARLCAAEASCLIDGSPYVERGACFLANARSEAEAADLIIVNHALLISNLLYDGAVIPHAPVVIVDEAHFLEQVVTEQLRVGADEEELRGLIAEVASSDSQHTATLARRAARIAAAEAEPLPEAVAAADGAIDQAWSGFDAFSREHASRGAELRVTSGIRSQPAWSEVEEHWESAKNRVAELQDALNDLTKACRNRAEELELEQRDVAEMLADESRDLSEALGERLLAANASLTADLEQTVSWFARDRRSGAIGLHAAPLNVGEQLEELLWPNPRSIILTGATLTVDDKWDFLRRQLHVPEAREAQYGSPFDYERNARVYIPSDMPRVQADDYDAAQANAIVQLARASEGRALALFTAHGTMRRVAERVQAQLEHSDIALEVQGRNGSPAQVVGALRNDPRTVVFGVNSLWTGIDIPGEHLSLLIVCRLPFDRPTDPIQMARAEQYDDPFEELTVPTAILRLRQGVGRLIRSRSDRGVAVILDNRVVTARYGSRFLNSLPPAPIEQLPLHQIAAAVKSFLPPLAPPQ